MATPRVKIDQGAADRAAAEIAYTEVVDVTRQLLNQSIIDTPVDLGQLRLGNQSTVERIGLLTRGVVWNDVEYAWAVHDGLPAQVIRPKTAKALRFEINGEVIFARKVTLPARKGRPWLADAAKKVANRRGYVFLAV